MTHLHGNRSDRDPLWALRDLPVPQPTARIIEGALARRAAGERVILPVPLESAPFAAPPARALRSRWMTAALATAAAMLVAALLMARTPSLQASSATGRLTFAPVAPQPGDSVTVQYTPSATLAGAPILRLRARVGGGTIGYATTPGTHQVAMLRRERDGSYHAVFRFPVDAAFATLAVEDTASTQIDTNLERYWSVIAGDGASTPAVSPMLVLAEQAQRWDWEQALTLAQRATALHPSRPDAWFIRYLMESELAGASAADSIRAAWQPRLLALHATLRDRQSVDPFVMTVLWRWAQEAKADSLERFWSGRLEQEAPQSRGGTELQFQRIGRVSAGQRLVALESLWNSRADSVRLSPLSGLFTATQTQDGDAIRRWGDRAVARDSTMREMVAATLVRLPAHRAYALAELQRVLQARIAPDDQDRGLGETRADAARRFIRMRHGTLVTIGNALADSGDLAVARRFLREGLQTGWGGAPHLRLADLELQLGDTVRAVAEAALAASDRLVKVDGLRARLGAAAAGASWDSAVVRASALVRARILADSRRTVLPASPRVTDSAGVLRSLHELSGRRPTVVVFWSRFCGPSVADLAALQRLAPLLQARNVPLVAVTHEASSTELSTFLRARALSFPVYHDIRSEGKFAFGAYATPFYYVLDKEGVVRFRTSLASIPRILDALE